MLSQMRYIPNNNSIKTLPKGPLKNNFTFANVFLSEP